MQVKHVDDPHAAMRHAHLLPLLVCRDGQALVSKAQLRKIVVERNPTYEGVERSPVSNTPAMQPSQGALKGEVTNSTGLLGHQSGTS